MKNALLVIDMQNDYLWEKRKKQFSYDSAALTEAVNACIHRYDPQEVIYIRHIIQNLPSNRLLFGYSIAGTEGAELYSGLDIVSDLCFVKYFGDALTSRALRQYLQEKDCRTLHLCGLDECGCVAATALGAAKRGMQAMILRGATASVFPPKKVLAMHAKLDRAGIRYI